MTSAATDLKQAFEQARDLDGSMSERLGVLADAMRRLTPDVVATIDRLVNRLKQHDAGENAPKPGEIDAAFRAAGRERSSGEPAQVCWSAGRRS